MSPQKELNPRIDKWLWAVRIFKTRSMATNACKKGRVLVNGAAAKASHTVKVGEIVELKTPPIVRTFRVLGLLEKRVAAKLVPGFMEETTPPEETRKLKMAYRSAFPGIRDRGAGRPTKKDRRDIEKFFDEELTDDYESDE